MTWSSCFRRCLTSALVALFFVLAKGHSVESDESTYARPWDNSEQIVHPKSYYYSGNIQKDCPDGSKRGPLCEIYPYFKRDCPGNLLCTQSDFQVVKHCCPDPTPGKSCRNRCGEFPRLENAWCKCDSTCAYEGDCCFDYYDLCLDDYSCIGRCGQPHNPKAECYCDKLCLDFDNCCSDYFGEAACAKPISCNDGTYTSTAHVCDGTANCKDLSDEPLEQCLAADPEYPGVLTCLKTNLFGFKITQYGVSADKICDNVKDCDNNADEKHCSG